MYKKTRLDNGLQIVSYPMPGRLSLAVGFWIKVGGRYETDKNKGISHFLEHLLFKGTKKYSYRKLKEAIEGIGGSFNGFTSEELTCYLVKVPAGSLVRAVDVLSSMVLDPLLPEVEVEKEKTVILEELKMYRDQPQSFVHELLDGLLWPNQPLGEPIIGSVESVTQTTQKDIRAFKEAHYTPANIVISASGAFKHEELVRLIKVRFHQRSSGVQHVFLPAVSKADKPQVKVFDKATEQSHLALGFHGFRRNHPLRHAAGLLHVILGGNMSSRLFNELREKRGLAYEIGTALKRYHDTGAFIIHAGIDNRKVPEAIKLIMRELSKVRTSLVSVDEFTRAREFYSGQLKLALEDTLDHMLWIGETTAALDRTYSPEQIMQEIARVSREDLRLVAREIFDGRKAHLALIGPLKAQEKKIRQALAVK